MDVLGDEYIAQHIYNEQYKEAVELSYKTYVTDGIKAMCHADVRWFTSVEKLINPEDEKPEPTVEEMLEMVHAVH